MPRSIAGVAVLCVLLTACNKSSGGPTSPGPSGPVVLTLSLDSLNIPERAGVVRWTGIPNATEYHIAVGTSAGAEDILSRTVGSGESSATLQNLRPRVTNHVRVTPRGVDGALAGTTSFYLVDFQAFVETVFFYSGPYSAETVFRGGSNTYDRTYGWPAGSRIRILLSSEVEDLRPTAEAVIAQLAEMTAGTITAFVESGGDNTWVQPHLAPVNTVKVVSTRDWPTNLCASNTAVVACARADSYPVPIHSRTMLQMGPDIQPSNRHEVFVHELGHALIGFKHFDGYFDARSPGEPLYGQACGPTSPEMIFPYSVMCTLGVRRGRTDFPPIEVEAAKRVYAAGLRPGASRGEFASRGLIP